jgi:outer membrane protein OmpA-like peptidoglycan-associated protein
MKKIGLLLFISTIVLQTSAQSPSKKSATDMLNELMEKANQINTKPTSNTSNKTNKHINPANQQSAIRKVKDIKTNKEAIEKNYEQLTASEKEKVKNMPPVPVAFRTNIDAQKFLDALGDFDLYKVLADRENTKSLNLTMFYAGYFKTKGVAEYIVAEAKKLRAEFEKTNPNTNFGVGIGKTYTSENALVYLPLGDASFVDEVISANYTKGAKEFPKENTIGVPDYILEKNLLNNKGIYSLGIKGSVVVKFTNNALVDANGADLFVFEAGEIEPTQVAISKDGNTWIEIGVISGGTASLDIKDFVKPNEYFYYVRLTDLDTKSGLPGADIDAVATIGSAMHLDLSAEILFEVGKSNLKKEGILAVEKLANSLQNISSAQIIIKGHTDDIGNDENNKKLSLQRAEAVSIILKNNLSSKINFTYQEIGKGKSESIVPNTSDANRKKNRRVEIIVNPN